MPDVGIGQARAIGIAVLAMGGEGGGVLADWLVGMAETNGYIAQSTSVPGVAQRTGATIYYVEIFPELAAAGREPVLALMPVPGDVDVVVASELMEAARAVSRGLVTPDKTTLVASTHRVYSMTERTAMGDGRADSAAMLATCTAAAHRLVTADMRQLAESTGSVISASLFGGLAGSGALPFTRTQFEDAIRAGGVGREQLARRLRRRVRCGARDCGDRRARDHPGGRRDHGRGRAPADRLTRMPSMPPNTSGVWPRCTALVCCWRRRRGIWRCG